MKATHLACLESWSVAGPAAESEPGIGLEQVRGAEHIPLSLL